MGYSKVSRHAAIQDFCSVDTRLESSETASDGRTKRPYWVGRTTSFRTGSTKLDNGSEDCQSASSMALSTSAALAVFRPPASTPAYSTWFVQVSASTVVVELESASRGTAAVGQKAIARKGE